MGRVPTSCWTWELCNICNSPVNPTYVKKSGSPEVNELQTVLLWSAHPGKRSVTLAQQALYPLNYLPRLKFSMVL